MSTTLTQTLPISPLATVRPDLAVSCHLSGDLLVLCGDTPALSPETLRALYDTHRQSGAAATVLTALLEDPSGYGRVLLVKLGLVCVALAWGAFHHFFVRPALNRPGVLSRLPRSLAGESAVGSMTSSVCRIRCHGRSLQWRISGESRQAARRTGAPAGAKGWLRVSMCQIASVSFLAMSIWATLAPRWRPRRFLLRW